MAIDAHQHFWTLGRGDYAWPTSDLEPIFRDFGPADLAPLLTKAGVDGTLLVQATPTLAETSFLLDLAARTSFVRGVVGWADFAAVNADSTIAELAANPLLKGLRPMIQTIPDDRWMLGCNLGSAFEALIRADLVFEALILPRHLPVLGSLLQRYPQLRVVIDHAAKPDIAGGEFDLWAREIAEIARGTEAACKLSGMWTQGGGSLHPDLYRRYVDHLLSCFGPKRLLWGSDWPVIRLAGDYADWLSQCQDLTARCSSTDREAIFAGNARSLYGLD